MERYSFESAQAEAAKLREKIDKGESESYKDANRIIETENAETWFKVAHEYGQQHATIIEATLGKRSFDDIDQEKFLDERLNTLSNGARAFVEKQQLKQNNLKLNARELLDQFFVTEEEKKLLDEHQAYRHVEIAPGIHGVFVPYDVLKRLCPNAQTGAVRPKDGIAFIILSEESKANITEFLMRENVPHEVHHLIWQSTRSRTNLFSSTESNIDVKASFMMFQDELLARISGDGALGGYSHLDLMPKLRNELERRNPGMGEKIQVKIIEMNDLLRELGDLIGLSAVVHKADLVQAVMDATNYDELQMNLMKVKKSIEKLPFKSEKKGSNGWGFV